MMAPGPAGGVQSSYRARSIDLDRLLDPMTSDEFLDGYWESRPLHIGRGTGGYYDNLLTIDSLDELITATTPGFVRAVDDGRVVRSESGGSTSQRAFTLDHNGVPDIEEIYRCYSEGYTVILNRLHCRSAAIAHLCQALEARLHHPVGANLYLTPCGSQGFQRHIDDHDVFILQMAGVKQWQVSVEPAYELPLVGFKQDRPGLSEALMQECLLKPGDLLYIPRGFAHEASTQQDDWSMHLTVGVQVFRWADLFAELVAVASERAPQLRKALPPGFLGESPAEAIVDHVYEGLMAGLSDRELQEKAFRRLGTRLLRTSKAATRSQFASIGEIGRLTVAAVVVKAPDALVFVERGADEVSIRFANNFVSGPVRLAEAFEFIRDRSAPFTIASLPGGLTERDKIDLIGRLVAEGLLSCPADGEGTK